MPEHLSKEHQQLRTAAQTFADALPRAPEQTVDAPTRAQIIAKARDLGLYALTQPRAYGGLEAGALALTVVRETLASANHPLTHFALGPGPGALTGAEGVVRARFLQPMLAGEKRAAFAFTEPKDGSRHTWATRDGEFLVINGVKPYVTGGAQADFFNTLVELQDGQRVMVCIERDTQGVVIASRFNSMEGGDHVRVEFHDARVPATHIHGAPGSGLRSALTQIGDTRLLMAAEACGLMLWVDQFVSRHLTQPHASGEPLAAREGVRLRYADLRMDTFVSRATLYRAARFADAAGNGKAATNEVTIAKVFCTEALGRVVDTAIQLCGGAALTRGHPLEALYRRVRSMRIAEGASDVLRLNLVRGHLDLHLGTL